MAEFCGSAGLQAARMGEQRVGGRAGCGGQATRAGSPRASTRGRVGPRGSLQACPCTQGSRQRRRIAAFSPAWERCLPTLDGTSNVRQQTAERCWQTRPTHATVTSRSIKKKKNKQKKIKNRRSSYFQLRVFAGFFLLVGIRRDQNPSVSMSDVALHFYSIRESLNKSAQA